MTTTTAPDRTTEPTRPGWYISATEPRPDYMLYLLLPDIDIPGIIVRTRQWMALTRDGASTECTWEYIAQAGPVTPLRALLDTSATHHA